MKKTAKAKKATKQASKSKKGGGFSMAQPLQQNSAGQFYRIGANGQAYICKANGTPSA